jgi:hypothetical protein
MQEQSKDNHCPPPQNLVHMISQFIISGGPKNGKEKFYAGTDYPEVEGS